MREHRPHPGVGTSAAPGPRRTRRACVALAAVAAVLGASPVAAQSRDRVDSTLPQTATRGERVLGTASQREAGEARLRESLQRQAEIDALFNPHRAAWGGMAMPIYPTVVAPYGAAMPYGPTMPHGGASPYGPPPSMAPPGAKRPLPCPPGACPPPKPSPASALRLDPQPASPGVHVPPSR